MGQATEARLEWIAGEENKERTISERAVTAVIMITLSALLP
jgi:hypothetical protein